MVNSIIYDIRVQGAADARRSIMQIGGTADRSTAQGVRGFRNLGRSAQSTSGNVDQLNNRASRLGQTFGRSSRFTRRLGDDMERLDRRMRRTNATALLLNRSFLGLFAGLAGAAGIGVFVRDFARLDDTLRLVQATAGATERQFRQFTDTAIFLGRTTRFNAQQAAEGLLFLAQAGLSVRESLIAIRPTLNFAIAAGLNLASAAEIATNNMVAFRLSIEEITRVMDVLTLTAQSSNTNVSGLANALRIVGPIAGQFNISIEDTNAVLAILANNALKGSRAGTGFRGVLSSLAAPSRRAANELRLAGLSLEDVDFNARGLIPVLHSLNGANLTSGQLFRIFGREAATAGSLMSQFSMDIEDMADSLRDANGTVDRTVELMDRSLRAVLIELQSAVSGFGNTFVRSFEEPLKRTIVVITDFINSISDLGGGLGSVAGIAASVGGALLLRSGFRGGGRAIAGGIVAGGRAIGAGASAGGRAIGAGLATQPVAQALANISRTINQYLTDVSDPEDEAVRGSRPDVISNTAADTARGSAARNARAQAIRADRQELAVLRTQVRTGEIEGSDPRIAAVERRINRRRTFDTITSRGQRTDEIDVSRSIRGQRRLNQERTRSGRIVNSLTAGLRRFSAGALVVGSAIGRVIGIFGRISGFFLRLVTSFPVLAGAIGLAALIGSRDTLLRSDNQANRRLGVSGETLSITFENLFNRLLDALGFEGDTLGEKIDSLKDTLANILVGVAGTLRGLFDWVRVSRQGFIGRSFGLDDPAFEARAQARLERVLASRPEATPGPRRFTGGRGGGALNFATASNRTDYTIEDARRDQAEFESRVRLNVSDSTRPRFLQPGIINRLRETGVLPFSLPEFVPQFAGRADNRRRLTQRRRVGNRTVDVPVVDFPDSFRLDERQFAVFFEAYNEQRRIWDGLRNQLSSRDNREVGDEGTFEDQRFERQTYRNVIRDINREQDEQLASLQRSAAAQRRLNQLNEYKNDLARENIELTDSELEQLETRIEVLDRYTQALAVVNEDVGNAIGRIIRHGGDLLRGAAEFGGAARRQAPQLHQLAEDLVDIFINSFESRFTEWVTDISGRFFDRIGRIIAETSLGQYLLGGDLRGGLATPDSETLERLVEIETEEMRVDANGNVTIVDANGNVLRSLGLVPGSREGDRFSVDNETGEITRRRYFREAVPPGYLSPAIRGDRRDRQLADRLGVIPGTEVDFQLGRTGTNRAILPEYAAGGQLGIISTSDYRASRRDAPGNLYNFSDYSVPLSYGGGSRGSVRISPSGNLIYGGGSRGSVRISPSGNLVYGGGFRGSVGTPRPSGRNIADSLGAGFETGPDVERDFLRQLGRERGFNRRLRSLYGSGDGGTSQGLLDSVTESLGGATGALSSAITVNNSIVQNFYVTSTADAQVAGNASANTIINQTKASIANDARLGVS